MIINGKSRILKWRYVSTIFLAIFCGDIPWNLGLKNRPYIWDWYLQSIGSWVMAIDMWIELDLPSGYLLHSHGESPFLSSVNHLFLWTIEKPWRSVSHNQRVTKSRWFFLWDWITWKDKPADNDVWGNLRLLLQLANKIDWWTFRPAKIPGKPGSIGFQAAWASKGCHQRWGSYMAMAPLGPSLKRVKWSSWVDPSWLVAIRQCPNKGPNMNRFNTKGGFLRAGFFLETKGYTAVWKKLDIGKWEWATGLWDTLSEATEHGFLTA